MLCPAHCILTFPLNKSGTFIKSGFLSPEKSENLLEIFCLTAEKPHYQKSSPRVTQPFSVLYSFIHSLIHMTCVACLGLGVCEPQSRDSVSFKKNLKMEKMMAPAQKFHLPKITSDQEETAKSDSILFLIQYIASLKNHTPFSSSTGCLHFLCR